MRTRPVRDERFCAHDSGEIVILGDQKMRCGDCHAEMTWVSRDYLDRLVSDLRDCRRGITRWAGE